MSVQCSTDVGFYQVRLPPPSTSQFLRQIDSDHPWSEARLSSLKVADFMLISKWICCYLVYWLPIAEELRLQLSNICYTCRAYILPSCCILQELQAVYLRQWKHGTLWISTVTLRLQNGAGISRLQQSHDS